MMWLGLWCAMRCAGLCVFCVVLFCVFWYFCAVFLLLLLTVFAAAIVVVVVC